MDYRTVPKFIDFFYMIIFDVSAKFLIR